MRALWLPLVATAGFAVAVVPALGDDQTVQVGEGGAQYTPGTVAVKPGETVTFSKQNSGFHNVHFSDATPFNGGTDAANRSPGTATFSDDAVMPTQEGTYHFFCDIHGTGGGTMKGIVEVNAAGTVPTQTQTGTTPTQTGTTPTTGTNTTPTTGTGTSTTPTTTGPTATGPASGTGDAPGAAIPLNNVEPLRDHFCTKRGPTCKRPGVTLRFDLGRAADVTGTVDRRARRFGPRGREAAARFRRFGTLRFRGRAGRNRVTFVRTRAGRRLTPADYRVTLTARNAGGDASVKRVVRFFVRPS